MDPWSIGLGALQAGGGLFFTIWNASQRDWNARREDTAVRRRATDMEAAGLSKTLAAGSAAQAQASPGLTNPLGDLNPTMVAEAKQNAQNLLIGKKQEKKLDHEISLLSQNKKINQYNLDNSKQNGLRTTDAYPEDYKKMEMIAQAFGLSLSEVATAIKEGLGSIFNNDDRTTPQVFDYRGTMSQDSGEQRVNRLEAAEEASIAELQKKVENGERLPWYEFQWLREKAPWLFEERGTDHKPMLSE